MKVLRDEHGRFIAPTDDQRAAQNRGVEIRYSPTWPASVPKPAEGTPWPTWEERAEMDAAEEG